MTTQEIKKIIKNAIAEDIGTGDITTETLREVLTNDTFEFEAGTDFVLSGTEVVKEVFTAIDPEVTVSFKCQDGYEIKKGMRFGSVSGNSASILISERVALNFLQHMSGISTYVSSIVSELIGAKVNKGKSIRILDTRKTTPGLRILEKYAVRVGGGLNHRFGLYDAAVIKENHINAVGSVEAAIGLIRSKIPVSAKIEVEVSSTNEAGEAVLAGADIILLNAEKMDMQTVIDACNLINSKALIELSGVKPEKIPELAKLPVDFISVASATQNFKKPEIKLVYCKD